MPFLSTRPLPNAFFDWEGKSNGELFVIAAGKTVTGHPGHVLGGILGRNRRIYSTHCVGIHAPDLTGVCALGAKKENPFYLRSFCALHPAGMDFPVHTCGAGGWRLLFLAILPGIERERGRAVDRRQDRGVGHLHHGACVLRPDSVHSRADTTEISLPRCAIFPPCKSPPEKTPGLRN